MATNKKKSVKVRDLKPKKDAKGGGVHAHASVAGAKLAAANRNLAGANPNLSPAGKQLN